MIHSQVLLYGNETWFSRIVHRRFIIAIFVLGGEGEEERAWDFYYRGRDFPRKVIPREEFVLRIFLPYRKFPGEGEALSCDIGARL